MYTLREYDIMRLEAEEENDAAIQDVMLEMLGNRAKRMMQNAETTGRYGNDEQAAPPAADQATSGPADY